MDTATLDLQVTKVTWKAAHRGSGRGQARGGRPGRYLVRLRAGFRIMH
jgi:hypothetical protein